MARRTQIIDALVDHLAANTDALPSNVIKRYAYLDEVNDFPAITITSASERRLHRGADARQGILLLFVRSYVFSDDDSLGTAETLGAQIESAIESFDTTYRNLEVEEARVLEFRTDEGLFHPYGLVDMQIQILYEVSNEIK